MATTVKQKIRLGTLFFFLLLILVGGISFYYLIRLKNDSRLILTNNYESLDYCHAMERALDSTAIGDAERFAIFDSALQQQEKNISEPGEQEATRLLRDQFDRLRRGGGNDSLRVAIDKQLQTILSLNMRAIEKKNQVATETADQAIRYISFFATIIFIVAITFAFNFPSIITSPINLFLTGIREIGEKNYAFRINRTKQDEFGQMAAAFNAMAERLEYFEKSNLNKLIFEKARAEAVINSLQDASIGIDQNNVILFANEQALQLLGLSAADTVGQAVAELSARNDLLRFLTGNDSTKPFKIVVDGKENYYTKELMQVSQGETKSQVIVLKNITSFKELDVAKTNFIATVSHELKTPLASSDFSLKLLEDLRVGSLNTEQSQLVQQLKQDNERMLRILSELLNLTQVEAGKIQLSLAIIKPEEIVQASVDAVHAAAREKKQSITQNIAPLLPRVNADPEKIGWVLINFLTNAIKYSPEATTIAIGVVAKGQSISFSVTDQGNGIEDQYLARIFERYFQVPGSAKNSGSGIGLAICKELIEAMGGRIWVRSKLDEGSVFGFDLPAL